MVNKFLTAMLLTIGLSSSWLSHAEVTEQQQIFDTLKKTQHWGLVRSGTTCIEKYNFMPSGEISIASNKERITGRYSFLENTERFGLPAVVIYFNTDNKQPDCSGDSTNQAGLNTTNFLKKVSDQEIYFCNDALGKDCPVYIKPQK